MPVKGMWPLLARYREFEQVRVRVDHSPLTTQQYPTRVWYLTKGSYGRTRYMQVIRPQPRVPDIVKYAPKTLGALTFSGTPLGMPMPVP